VRHRSGRIGRTRSGLEPPYKRIKLTSAARRAGAALAAFPQWSLYALEALEDNDHVETR